MTTTYDTIFKGGTVVNHDGIGKRDVGVRDGRIAAIGDLGPSTAGKVIDCTGLHILPGVVDSQVHFREPGLEHKEDLETGSRAAVLGGVTSVFEMPNTKPLTTSEAALEDKIRRGRHRMHCDFAFWVGGTRENARDVAELERLPGAAGIKVFMGSSTGDLLVEDDEGVKSILRNTRRRAAFHSEDEFRLRERENLRVQGDPSSHPVWRDPQAAMIATERLVRVARETGARVHVLHISTAEEMEFLRDHKDVASVEVTPHHLTLEAPDCYARLGTRAQMNPPVRDAAHKAGIWAGLTQGVVDVLGSDHAPHTLEEKALPYAQALNDYDTADFAAAFIAGNKTGPKDVQLLPHGAWEVSAPLDEPMIALITVTQFTTGHVHVFIELALQLSRGEWMTLKLGSEGLKKLASRAL